MGFVETVNYYDSRSKFLLTTLKCGSRGHTLKPSYNYNYKIKGNKKLTLKIIYIFCNKH